MVHYQTFVVAGRDAIASVGTFQIITQHVRKSVFTFCALVETQHHHLLLTFYFAAELDDALLVVFWPVAVLAACTDCLYRACMVFRLDSTVFNSVLFNTLSQFLAADVLRNRV